MRILICEDNREEAPSLASLIEETVIRSGDICEEITIFTSAQEVLDSVRSYDLLFLDCKLPDINGTDLAKMLREQGCTAEIIFVTAFAEFAVDGYESNALRYLMKPVKEEKLKEAIDAYLKKQQFNEKIDIKNSGKPFIVRPSEIQYIETVGNKTIVRLSGNAVNSSLSLAEFERIIRYPTLVRSSRQFIVNLQYISSIDGRSVTMENGEHVTISRRNFKKIIDLYKQYLSSNYYQDDE